jgi:hypothetical protein
MAGSGQKTFLVALRILFDVMEWTLFLTSADIVLMK